MNLRVITAPAAEPVSTATAKSHLRVDHASDDELIESYIKTARELGEGLARRAFITQTLELVLDEFPRDLKLKLPRPPLQSVTSVKYLDADNVEYTFTDYVVDARSEPGVITFNSTPGVALAESGAVAVRFVAGYGATATAVPNVFVQAVLLSVAHFYEFREAVDIPNFAQHLFLSDRGSWF